MPNYRVKLVADAFERAQGQDVNVSLFESQERYDQRVGDDGYVLVRKREFDRLSLYGLIEDAETDPIAETRNPDLDEDSTRARTLIPRLPQRTTAVHPGGVGHQPGDAYGNDQVQREYDRQVQMGEAQARERGIPKPEQSVLEASKRADGHLPEQVKEHERLTREHEQIVDKARKEAEKTREKAAKEHERQEAKDQERVDKERERRSGTTQEIVDPPKDAETSRKQGAGLVEDQNRETRNRGDGEAKADDKAKGGTGSKSGSGATKDKG